jgi:hypothetical protein
MKKCIGMIIIAGLCGSAVADVVTNATITAFASDIPETQGVADDLFQNATVTSDSGAHPIRDIRDLFTLGSPVVNNEMLFKDVDGTPLSYVEFNTECACSLTNITIGLGSTEQAGVSNDLRAVERVKVYAQSSAGSFTAGDLIANIAVDPEYTDAYGDRFLTLSMDLSSVTSQYFRIEFTEPLGGDYIDRGAWVFEIDGFGEILYDEPIVTNATIAAFANPIPVVVGTSEDLFQNATITTNSEAHTIRNITDLFTQGSPVVDNEMIFKDVDGDALSYVEFNTEGAYSLTNITIGLGNGYVEGGANDTRSIENVKIYARLSEGSFSACSLVADVDVNPEYTEVYGERYLTVSIDLPSVDARYFRVEFTEPLGGSYLDRGARVYEIDGFGTAYIPPPEPIGPASIMGWSLGSNSVMRMVVNAPSSASNYYPKATSDLMAEDWAGVPHSSDGVAPFLVTNLVYSTPEGSNEVIYVQVNQASGFFKVVDGK